jgi:hypothetical protein
MSSPIQTHWRQRAGRCLLQRTFFIWLPTLLLAFGAVRGAQAQSNSLRAPAANDVAAAPKSTWERIAVIGASASAGFTTAEPFGSTNMARYRLSRYLDAALLSPHQPVTNLANALFFLQPETMGRNQIDLALKLKPTLVLGMDFPFWFCYGNLRTNETRQQRFEAGLQLLEKIPCRLLLGDIPDASAAANGMLGEKEIPSADEMAAANRRLRSWAEGRPQVIIFPLADFMRTAMANQALTVHGAEIPAGQTRVLIQEDKLHPSVPGCATLAVAILDVIQAKEPPFSAANIRWDPKELLRQVPQ